MPLTLVQVLKCLLTKQLLNENGHVSLCRGQQCFGHLKTVISHVLILRIYFEHRPTTETNAQSETSVIERHKGKAMKEQFSSVNMH